MASRTVSGEAAATADGEVEPADAGPAGDAADTKRSEKIRARTRKTVLERTGGRTRSAMRHSLEI